MSQAYKELGSMMYNKNQIPDLVISNQSQFAMY